LRPLTCGPGLDADVNQSHPSHLTQVSHRFWRCVGPCHGSRLLPLKLPFRSHDSAAVFCIATLPDSFHGRCLGLVAIPTRTPALSLLSEDFVWLAVTGQFWIPAVPIFVVGNRYPLGNYFSTQARSRLEFLTYSSNSRRYRIWTCPANETVCIASPKGCQ
jgi:hypothetical protein